MNQEIMKELAEVEDMVKEATKHEEYTEKYFILREGMIKLAGGFVQAALLSSLIGWTRHWLKTDNEIYKQIKAAAEVGNIDKIRRLKQQIRQGWFWKAYREMSEELLGEVSIKTCQRYVEKFEEMGLISSHDPEEKTTYRARWYKANIDKIKEELEKMGYQLDYYKDQKAICQNDKSQNKGVSVSKSLKPLNSGICQNDKPYGQNDKSSGQNDKHLLYSSFNNQSFNPKGDDDAGAVDPQPWETDFQYKGLRQIFTKVGADDIFDHKKHYKTFQQELEKVGYSSLCLAAENYTQEEGKDSQIVYFLSGVYNNYLPKKKAKKKTSGQAPSGSDLPQSLREQQAQPAAHDADPEEQAKIRKKLAEMNDRWRQKKEKTGAF